MSSNQYKLRQTNAVRRFHNTLVALALLCLVIHAQPVAAKEPISYESGVDRALVDEVSKGIQNQIDAIPAMQFQYELSINGSTRKCVMAFEGDKWYMASAVMNPDGTEAGPVGEGTFNGTEARTRRWGGDITVTKRPHFPPGSGSPFSDVLGMFASALGVKVPGYTDETISSRWTFIGARRLTATESHLVELVARNVSRGYDARFVFDARHGYWPIESQTFQPRIDDAAAVVTGRSSTQDFVELDVLGNRVFIPGTLTIEALLNGEVANVLIYRVDRDSIRLGDAIDEAVFTMQPYPRENIRDLETGRLIRKADDPTWFPKPQDVNWPWKGIAEREAKRVQGGRFAVHDPSQSNAPQQADSKPADALVLPGVDSESGWDWKWVALVSGGAALLIYGIYRMRN
jgi:hypothetical protein